MKVKANKINGTGLHFSVTTTNSTVSIKLSDYICSLYV